MPEEARAVSFDDLLLSSRLEARLASGGYRVLADLEGRTFEDLHRLPRFGAMCWMELRAKIKLWGVVVRPEPAPRASGRDLRGGRLHVPPFALGHRLDELPFTTAGAAAKLGRNRIETLADVHGKTRADLLRLPCVGRVLVSDLVTVVDRLRENGPADRCGLLDGLDLALDRLDENRRVVLLHRFGGMATEPSAAMIATMIAPTAARRALARPAEARIIEARAVRDLRVLAGPEFGALLRELEARPPASEADLVADLERGRAPVAPSDPSRARSWATMGFYVRLLVRLAPGLAAWTP